MAPERPHQQTPYKATNLAKHSLDVTFNINFGSASGGSAFEFLPFSVLNAPTAAQCTSPETNEMRTRFSMAIFCSCSMSQLRSFCRRKVSG